MLVTNPASHYASGWQSPLLRTSGSSQDNHIEAHYCRIRTYQGDQALCTDLGATQSSVLQYGAFREIWTPNLLITNQLHYRCAMKAKITYIIRSLTMGVFAFPFMFPVRPFARYYSALAQPRSASALWVVLIDYSIFLSLLNSIELLCPTSVEK
jgi:hypothetical protein